MKRFILVSSFCMLFFSVAANDAGTTPATTQPAQQTPAPKKPIDDFIAYIEWVFDTPLTMAQREEATRIIEKARSDKSTPDMQLVDEAVAAKQDFVNHSEKDRQALRPSVEDEYLKALRKRHRNQSIAKWVLAMKENFSKPIAPGTPPLTRQSADAFCELLAFALKEVAITPSPVDDQTFRDAFAKSIAADFKDYDDKQKAALAEISKNWATLRTSWPSFAEPKKLKIRNEWRETMKSVTGPKPTGDDKALAAAAKTLVVKVGDWLK